MVPTSLTGFVISLALLPRVLRAVGPARSLVVGLVTLAAGQLWLGWAPTGTAYVGGVLPALVLVATGVALSFTPTTMVVAAAVPDSHAGLASGLAGAASQVGTALGAAGFTAIALGGGGFPAAFTAAALVALLPPRWPARSCGTAADQVTPRPDRATMGAPASRGGLMGLISDVRVRQPANDDLVGRMFLVAGHGAGFEGTIGMRLLGPAGRVIGQDSAQSQGGGIGVGEFSARLTIDRPPRPGTVCTLEVFGDNPGLPDEGPKPGFNTRRVRVIVFPDMAGWLLYRVDRGDTLSGIVRELRDFGRFTVAQVVAANPRITDPDHIEPGWRLRIPLKR
jgi:MFS family permease